MCYFIDKNLIMMVEVMFKNWGLDRQPKETMQDRGRLNVIL